MAVTRVLEPEQLIGLDRDRQRAAQPMPTELGTLDAIHLATALLWKDVTREDLVLATHDDALALGAQAHGLPVVGVTQTFP